MLIANEANHWILFIKYYSVPAFVNVTSLDIFKEISGTGDYDLEPKPDQTTCIVLSRHKLAN